MCSLHVVILVNHCMVSSSVRVGKVKYFEPVVGHCSKEYWSTFLTCGFVFLAIRFYLD